MFKTINTKFINGINFSCQRALDLEFFNYVHWFNNIRFYESLDYLTPVEYNALLKSYTV
ncbi:IS3 family transposase [Ornithinibacillus gellani]|uniref:IS3 family transposase n=1 Tax=Ornithinibacillus gellani TaxID=2293253 RepID=UPI000F465E00|nr:IS3 family transposase [Ornithinibacillus gellani]